MPAYIEVTDPLLNGIAIDASNQSLIEALIRVASAQIDTYCNRHFTYAEYTETLNGNGGGEIIVRNPPIESITSVTLLYPHSDNIVYDTTYFDFSPELHGGEIRWAADGSWGSCRGFSRGWRNIVVIYQGGFPVIPDEIKYVTSEIVKQLYSPELASGLIAAEKLGDYFYKLDKDSQQRLFAPVRAILMGYKLNNIPVC